MEVRLKQKSAPPTKRYQRNPQKIETSLQRIIDTFSSNQLDESFLINLLNFKQILNNAKPDSHPKLFEIDSIVSQLLQGNYSYQIQQRLQIFNKNPNKKPYLLQAEENFKQEVSKFSVKMMMELKKIPKVPLPMKELILSFLILLSQVDPQARFAQGIKQLTSRLEDEYKKYISNPGRVIQLIRKFPQFIREEKVSLEIMSRAQEHLVNVVPKKLVPIAYELYKVMIEIVKIYQSYNPFVESSSIEEEGEKFEHCSDQSQQVIRSIEESLSIISIENQDTLSPYLQKTEQQSVPIKPVIGKFELEEIRTANSSQPSLTPRSHLTSSLNAKAKLLQKFLLKENQQETQIKSQSPSPVPIIQNKHENLPSEISQPQILTFTHISEYPNIKPKPKRVTKSLSRDSLIPKPSICQKPQSRPVLRPANQNLELEHKINQQKRELKKLEAAQKKKDWEQIRIRKKQEKEQKRLEFLKESMYNRNMSQKLQQFLQEKITREKDQIKSFKVADFQQQRRVKAMQEEEKKKQFQDEFKRNSSKSDLIRSVKERTKSMMSSRETFSVYSIKQSNFRDIVKKAALQVDDEMKKRERKRELEFTHRQLVQEKQRLAEMLVKYEGQSSGMTQRQVRQIKMNLFSWCGFYFKFLKNIAWLLFNVLQ